MKEKRPATPSKPSAGTSRRRKTPVTETKESGRAAVLPAQSDLFASVSGLIEEARRTLARQANSTTLFLFWRIGQQVNSEIQHHQRAEYGQKIVTTLATQLVASYGRSFEARNLRCMMQFAEQFPDFGIVSPLATQLSWSHVVEVLALKTPEARLFYLGEAATRQFGKRELRRMRVATPEDVKLVTARFRTVGAAKRTPLANVTYAISYGDSDYAGLAKHVGYQLP